MTLGETRRSVPTGFWSAHTHSRYSKDDALSSIPEMVAKAVDLRYPALGLTDHGKMPGAVELYRACNKAGIAPAPGIELYVTHDALLDDRKSMHLTVLAYTEQGYRNLVALHNTAWRQFRYRPRVDFADLAKMAEDGKLQGLAIGTGCRSGPVVRALTENGEWAARQVVNALAGWFPRTYVEVMDHHFAADGMHDSEITDALFEIAYTEGLPMIVTGDSHYVERDDKVVHDAFKELVTWSDDPEEGRFNGYGYHLLEAADLEHMDSSVVKAGLEGLADLAEALKVRIPEADTFSLKIPDLTMTGQQQFELEMAAAKAFDDYAKDLTAKQRKAAGLRLDAELEVIDKSGMAGYMLVISWICTWMRAQRIWYRTRGSASGSFLCYLLGITQEDPTEAVWDIRFDRFLSEDRTSPPDVDLDIEHLRRDEVVAMIKAEYPVVQVGTRMHYGLDEEAKGSLRAKYFSTLAKSGVDTKTLQWASVDPMHKAILEDLSERRLIASTGAHPGGYVVASDPTVFAVLPLEQIGSSGTFVTSFDKGEIESLGYPKIDLLGSKALTAWRICCNLAASGKQLGDTLEEQDAAIAYFQGIEALPNTGDKEVMKKIRSGDTAGMFQLEGWANRSGCEELKPTKVRDIVALTALYRPAAMSSGFKDSFIARRNKTEEITPQHADIAAETKETYGVALYQEQVVGVLRRIGMGSVELTKMLKAIKSSGKAGEAAAKVAVAEALPSIQELARGRGWEEADVEWLSHALTQYGAGYSFNKGHSVAYGVGAYLSAVLAVHQPLAFWTGMLVAYTGSEKKGPRGTKIKMEDMYAGAARDAGIRVARAHVNKSDLGYTADPSTQTILKGLVSVPNVGESAALELIDKRPFESLVDLSLRVTGKVSGAEPLRWGTQPHDCTGVVKALADHHALEGVPIGEPLRKAKGRIRRCKECKHTFATPLEYEDHAEEVHGASASEADHAG